jgi:hypothetical protein
MVEGGPIDVLTGDWLAELTMLILARTRGRRPGGGYAGTFVRQMEEVMGTCLDRGIKVVSNAGGLDPAGCAEAVARVAERLGLSPTIAYITGDDLMDRLAELNSSGDLQSFGSGEPLGDPDEFLTANAYLGCWGIAEALGAGADIVITGRVTDAALACGPAAWYHGWERDDFDQLAGAVVAGHVIECSAQATGGNYSFLADDILDRGALPVRLGFPWAEITSDGGSVIGKHDGTGGVVTVGTVTSQLLYEIAGPDYIGPDVTARFDSINLEQIDRDRVRISGVRGQAPPDRLKVAMNEVGGYRNSFTVALTGLDIPEKLELAQNTFWDACPYGPNDFEEISSVVARTDRADADTQDEATATWRLTVKSRDEAKAGRMFSDAIVHTALSSIAGMYLLGDGPAGAKPFGVYRPASVPAELVPQHVHVGSAPPIVVESVVPQTSAVTVAAGEAPEPDPVPLSEPTIDAPLGTLVGARSGDKGANANLGLFVREAAQFPWLDAFLTVDRLKDLLPEVRPLTVRRYRLPNLHALNFVIEGFLEEGVAACTRQDRQAKALGEWLRSRIVAIPRTLTSSHSSSTQGART